MCDLVYLRYHAALEWYQSKVSSYEMSSGNNVDDGPTRDGAHDAEVQGAEQPVPKAVVDAMD